METDIPQFDEETWAELPAYLEHLPEPVLLNIWGDEQESTAERESVRLAQRLSQHFTSIDYQLLPRRVNFPYYPVIGVLGLSDVEPLDFGVRIVGLPAGFQMTSLIAAIQSVSFRGMTSEAMTRIRLHRLGDPVSLELYTAAQDESGALMAKVIFDMAVVSDLLRSFLVMGDAFPESLMRYSISEVPHLVINGRVHIQGLVSEETIVDHIAQAVKEVP